ncbi:Fic family protein [Maribacter aurantiacus]|uniref:Fic family protein n=1 Tax=Maribacter aurantiacus TaxID=1882343 RepID=A0A5R8M4B0_9FLAO|nr:Fic family protein [Maribacter aurantiacus]TLF44462.1 Fic family protein [Maribacter aurantiacus]
MARNIWNWQSEEWPHFSYDKDALSTLELQFSQNTGTVLGALKHVRVEEKNTFLVEVLSSEALKTSEIEGEYLNRDSIQSSIKNNLGFSTDKRKVPPAEYGISEMMVDLYHHYDTPLTHEQLFQWHRMITNGRRDLTDIGKYRTHSEPMQVVSGRLDRPTVHFEAPPSERVQEEMEKFVSWFNKIHQEKNLLPLALSGLVHLYFVCIHPFEDGNGRIARALAEKSLGISIGQPALISLSKTIEAKRKDYYDALEANNKNLEVTDWLRYFARTVIQAQEDTLITIDFIIEKAKFYDRFAPEMNERQKKVIKRLFEAGPEGFTGGLSADNYTKIAKTSASTATRDLGDMLQKRMVIKTGQLKGTRYYLNLKPL